MKRKNTLVIAEAGVNHNGDLGMALQLVDVAAQAGADLVKFQTFSAERLAVKDARKADYQQARTGNDESQFDMLRKLELSRADHEAIRLRCVQQGIGFFSTGFDIDSLVMLADMGQKLFKIPSGELTNLPYLREIARLADQIIMSTGMANLADIEAAIDALERAGKSREKITVLHCTTEYPAPFNEINLRVLPVLQASFAVDVGYSDHTTGIEVAIAAVALGATVIEKHFTLDRSLPGPDHAASLEPHELKAMVASIRNIEDALGSTVKRRTASEERNVVIARKSIVAARPIKAGEVFSADNLTAKRPGSGISPMRWDEVIGRSAGRDFDEDELIML